MVYFDREERGARILDAIKNAGYTQKDMAEMLGVSAQAATKWIKTGKIQVDNLWQIAELTGTDMYFLLTGEDKHLRTEGVAGLLEELTGKELQQVEYFIRSLHHAKAGKMKISFLLSPADP